MKNTLKIDHANGLIIMDRTFSKKQSNTDSREFRRLMAIHRDFPDYEIITKKISKNANKESYKGLTYEYMERYIHAHPRCNEYIEKYSELRFLAECHSIRYPTIKKWFLNTFPEIKEFHLNVA